MKILIVSDTHGRIYHFSRIIDKIGPIDMLIHLGDFEGHEDEIELLANCETHFVGGNNDFFSSLEREQVFSVGPYTIFMTHGHRYGVNYGIDKIVEAGKEFGANIIMFGHTHKPLVERREGIYVVNPGSISQPRQEGRIPSCIIMEIDRFQDVHFTINFVD